MNDYFFYFLVLAIIIISVRNFISLKNYRKEKEYVDTYGKFLRDEDNAYQQINDYVERHAGDAQFVNKGRILKVYGDIDSHVYSRDNLQQIDLKPIFYKNDKFSKKKTLTNSDSFVWLILDMAKAGSMSMMDVVDNLNRKLSDYENDLADFVEYRMCKATYEIIRERRGDGIAFLKSLLNGEYSSLTYDKRLIGVYKNMAASLLVYSGETVNEYDLSELNTFATKLVGHRLLKDLGLLDRYLKEGN